MTGLVTVGLAAEMMAIGKEQQTPVDLLTRP